MAVRSGIGQPDGIDQAITPVKDGRVGMPGALFQSAAFGCDRPAALMCCTLEQSSHLSPLSPRPVQRGCAR